MPYIKQEKRPEIVCYEGDHIRIHEITNGGELNFAITHLVKQYLYNRTELKDIPVNYQVLSDINSALDLAKDEFWKRIILPYEKIKREENGDVLPVKTEEL